LIFSGYDSHRDDCGKETTGWTEPDFAALTIAVLEVAKKANCPLLSNHGGGYKLPITIASAVSHVKTLASYG
jgi:acetoin utilization deacetylase AcuC-like enzyme